jgi:dUTP pyrophosphatase
MARIQVELLNENCFPYKKHPKDAGWDLKSSNKTFTLKPSGKIKVSTGIKIKIPEGNMGLIIPRSGLGSKNRLGLANTVGCVDSDYRGEVFCFLVNDGYEDVVVEQYMRFAQLIIVPVNLTGLYQVSSVGKTERGEGGFGSTGK